MTRSLAILPALCAVAMLGATACGGDDVGQGPGRPGGSSGSAATSGAGGSPDVLDPPEPGTCRALCCTADDCAAGQSCETFDAASGSFGVCSGLPGADGGAPASGDPLPAGCWTQGAASCNPLSNAGCSAGEACDFGGADDPTLPPEIACYDGENTQARGAACDAANGPWCVPGFHCVPD
jgi:hypothetical protein